jgi:hypothetical protein
MKARLIKFFLLFFILLSLPLFTLAQDDPYGVNDLGVVLDQDLDPKSSLVNIINIALGFLGLIAVIIVIYGGFVWMTSGGEAEKVNKAKQILKNGLIGLIIVLVSWGIVTFVIKEITGFGGDGTSYTDPELPFQPGFGAIGSCTLESVYPEPDQKEVPRNTSILITFKENIDPLSICVENEGGETPCDCDTCEAWINLNNIQIFKTLEGNSTTTNFTNAKATISNDKTIVVTPQEWLGSPDGNIDYSIKLRQIEKEEGEFPEKLMFHTCSPDWFEWSFQVSNKLDLDPPRVVSGGIFPVPDDEEDVKDTISAEYAQGYIEVIDEPTPYQEAEVSVTGNNNPTISINSNYNGAFEELKIVANETIAQLTTVDGEPLHIANWNNNKVVFSDFYNLTLEVDSFAVGDDWDVSLTPQVLADNLTIGNIVYSFTESGSGPYEIQVESVLEDQTQNILDKINPHPQIIAQTDAVTTIELTAKVGGSGGNNINLSTTNSGALDITPMSGGVDEGVSYIINGKKDQPRNSTIQINFNEAMNPLTLSGTSAEVEDYIKVLDDTNTRVDGSFMISNQYRTVEFVSNDECGTNACGGKIYCLPAGNLKVELNSADLIECNNDADCVSYQPFSSCQNSALGYKTCQDSDDVNLPTIDIASSTGIMDISFNSLDGNRDEEARGPVDFYNENSPDIANGDNYKWSFFISDEINLDPPKIEAIQPINNSTSTPKDQVIKATFDSLMRNSTIRTGSTVIDGNTHKRVNLRSLSHVIGYWLQTNNIDSDSNGSLDQTEITIKHRGLPTASSWRPQFGSGLENIYQNCFKPSASNDCLATTTAPSCCFGVPTELLINGNCE